MGRLINRSGFIYTITTHPWFVLTRSRFMKPGMQNQINPVQVISGEAHEGWISWDGRLPRGAYWQPNHEYKAVLEVLGTNGKKDVVHPLFFKTLTMSDTTTEKFKNVEDPP